MADAPVLPEDVVVEAWPGVDLSRVAVLNRRIVRRTHLTSPPGSPKT